MLLTINKRTKTSEILPFLTTSEALQEVLDKVPPVALKTPLLNMSIEEFDEIVNDEETFISDLLNHKRAFKAFGMLKQYKTEIEGINKFLKMMDVPQTAEEKQAALGVMFPSMIERMLITCAEFFHLRSFEEASKVKVGEYLLILKRDAADAKYQRNFQKIIEKRTRKK